MTGEGLLNEEELEKEMLKLEEKVFQLKDDKMNMLYLIKWKNLSYNDATWEPYYLIQDSDARIEDFEKANRSLSTS